MARSFNKVILVGNLVKDPQGRITAKGKNFVRARIAVDDSYGGEKRTYFFDVVFWEKMGEILMRYTKKGAKILVEGRLVQMMRESKNQNGEKVLRSDIFVVAENMLLLSSRSKDDGTMGDIADRVNGFSETSASSVVGQEGVSLEEKECDYGLVLDEARRRGLDEESEEGEEFDDGFSDYDEVEEDGDYSELDRDEEVEDMDTKREFNI